MIGCSKRGLAWSRIFHTAGFEDDPADKDEEGPPPRTPSLPDHLASFARRASKVDPNVEFGHIVPDIILEVKMSQVDVIHRLVC